VCGKLGGREIRKSYIQIISAFLFSKVWSPVLRSWCVECPDRELILANVQYDHVLEVLSAIHPTYKEVDDQTVHLLLPIAFDYQVLFVKS